MSCNIRAFKNKNKYCQGFTLIEIMVVLIIIAIMIALLAPRLGGWVLESKKKAAATEAQQVLNSMQLLISENYAMRKTDDVTAMEINADFITKINESINADIILDTTEEIGNFDNDNNGGGGLDFQSFTDRKTPTFYYKAKNGIWVKYDATTKSFTAADKQGAL